MTAFSDHQNSIDADYARLGLAAYRGRTMRHRRLGLRLAALLKLPGMEARRFAKGLTERCAETPSDESFYNRMIDDLSRRGLEAVRG